MSPEFVLWSILGVIAAVVAVLGVAAAWSMV
jgi:hypothetical protein